MFLTTNYMEEAATADYIIIINHGQIAAKGTPYDLQEQYSSDRIHIKTKDRDAVIRVLDVEQMPYTIKNGLLTADLSDTVAAIPLLEKAGGCFP